MAYQLTDWDLEQITNILDWNDAGTVMRYSGRAMYGDQCLGIVTEDEVSTFLILGSALTEAGQVGVKLIAQLLRSVRTDSMGRDSVVVYFPSITMPEGFVEEDEDNE